MKSTQRLFWLLTAILILALMGCDRLFAPPGNLVARVSDGDTLTVKDDSGKNLTVRFACVDAPEVPHSKKEKASQRASDRNQFQWGEQAQQRVQQLVKQAGDRVKLNITDQDRYGRNVAEVRLGDGTLIQEVLVREGLALVYRPYLNNCPSREIIQQAQAQAQEKKRGVWGDKKFTTPWEFRALSRRS